MEITIFDRLSNNAPEIKKALQKEKDFFKQALESQYKFSALTFIKITRKEAIKVNLGDVKTINKVYFDNIRLFKNYAGHYQFNKTSGAKIYCFEEEGLEPDMLLLGKALGNGIHVGTALMKDAPGDFYRLALVGGAGDTEFTYAAGCAVFEELLEDISFNAGGDEMPDVYLNINAEYVKEHLKKMMNLPDPHKYIL